MTAFSALGGVCHAQTADGAGEDRLVVVVQQDPGFDARLVLARELLDISVGPNFAKEFERVISDQISKSGSEGGEEMAWLRTNMPPMLSRMVVRLIDEMAPSYARIFTEEELRGQIAFYRSPLGQAVAAKTLTLGVALQEAQTRVMVEFLGELETKYCARFGCGEGQAAAKPGRHSPG
ncbi:DUF2059 domain-containing protein [Pseudomonas sp. ODNR1LW]|nr:DUF2059 domain-containing protein [Pseudomonas sp. ODNR1LW]